MSTSDTRNRQLWLELNTRRALPDERDCRMSVTPCTHARSAGSGSRAAGCRRTRLSTTLLHRSSPTRRTSSQTSRPPRCSRPVRTTTALIAPTYVPPGVNANGVYTTPITPASKGDDRDVQPRLDDRDQRQVRLPRLPRRHEPDEGRGRRGREPLRRHSVLDDVGARQAAVHGLPHRLRVQDAAPQRSGREMRG